VSVQKNLPYGAWPSAISTALLVGSTVRLGGVSVDGSNFYWLEGRPTEGGRNVLVRHDRNGETTDLTPRPYNVCTRVHEYGGGAYVVQRDTVWFCNDADQCIYEISGTDSPRQVTRPGPYRYADLLPDLRRNRLIAVREDHEGGNHEPRNELVAVDLQSGGTSALASGSDFYASPALSPSGDRLMWLSWEHPNMPWVSTFAWLANLDEQGSPGLARCLAGGEAESVFQPTFGPDAIPYLVSDRGGWWNIYRCGDSGLDAVCTRQAEFGRPQWQFSMRTFEFLDERRILCCFGEAGYWHLATLAIDTGELRVVPCGLGNVDAFAVEGNDCIVLGGSDEEPAQLRTLDLDTGAQQRLCSASSVDIDARTLSPAQAISFPTGDGEVAHAFLYRPRGYVGGELNGAPGTRPPLLVFGHGGPTGATSPELELKLQFWTSRGFAVLDVNYRGSTGYGRAYRDRLAGGWGIVDVEDCVAGAQYLGQEGLADPNRLAIRGGSAGGYTALAALCFHDTFNAGASHYGISDLAVLARDTHKFESRYLDWLVGPYPQSETTYAARSPIHHVDKFTCPVIFFQGLEDKVVPPNQAELMVNALDDKGLSVAYLAFAGEQHGFRRAETIQRTLEAELYFYGRIFGFVPHDIMAPVDIRNLP